MLLLKTRAWQRSQERGARLREARQEAAEQAWAKRRKDELWLGHTPTVIKAIEALVQANPAQADDLRSEAGYFRNNSRRMQYLEFDKEGYPVGSGAVESGCKQVGRDAHERPRHALVSSGSREYVGLTH